MSDTLDLVIQKGIPFYKSFQYAIISDGLEQPIPLHNAKLQMKVRHTAANPNVLFEADNSNYLALVDPVEGIIGLQIPKDVIDSFGFKKAQYDILITLPNKDPIKLIGGKVEIRPLVSRG